MNKYKQAIILAGGKGTRLEPYATCIPKPLMPIGEQPIEVADYIEKPLMHYPVSMGIYAFNKYDFPDLVKAMIRKKAKDRYLFI